ncbi:hypothetical protein DMENIID0001_119300 [Sergentomyia squamirostris]
MTDIFTSTSPVITVIGPSIPKVTEFFGCFKDLKYDFSNMKDAIEFCLQMCLTFELNFNRKCNLAWEFLAGYCYDPDKISEARVKAVLKQVN